MAVGGGSKAALQDFGDAAAGFVALLVGERGQLHGVDSAHGLESAVVELELRLEARLGIDFAESVAQLFGRHLFAAFFGQAAVHIFQNHSEIFEICFKRRSYRIAVFESFYKAFHLNNKS